MKPEDKEYLDAFQENVEPKPQATDDDEFGAEPMPPQGKSDDEEFGLTEPEVGSEPEAAAEPQPEPESKPEPEPEAPPVEAPVTEETSAGSPPPESAPEVAVVVSATPEEGPLSPEDEQRKRSWEGRLKKREEELAAREAQLKGPEAEPAAEAPQEEGNAAEASPDAEASPSPTPEETNEVDYERVIGEDFGPDFLNLLMGAFSVRLKAALSDAFKQVTADIEAKTEGRIGGVEQTLNAAIESLNAMHKGEIADEHADFEDIIASPQFGEWKSTLTPERQARVDRICEGGSARQCIALLSEFKASLTPPEEPDRVVADGVTDDELAAAEGVRSSGLKIPAPVGAPVGFEDTWKELPD